MEEFKTIEFHQTRDFGKKVNITFEFVKQNFKPLAKSILLIAGPAVLIGSIFLASFFSDLFSSVTRSQTNPQESLKYFSSLTFGVQMMLMYLFLILSYVITLATINGYIETYYQKKTNQIRVADVWEAARPLIWRFAGSLLLILILAVVLIVAIALLAGLFKMASTALMVLWIIAAIVGFIYLMIGMALLFFIQAHEGLGFFEAAGRSLQLIKGKWWSTFGIAFVLSLIGSTISYIFIIPYYAFMFITMIHGASDGTPEISDSMKTITYIFFTLYYMAQMLLQTLPQVGLVFQYFNLVEQKEAKGLMGDIESFGKQAPTTDRNETF
ncbi:MAG: hypothetical protein JST43_01315 [Bacteroidetes bacterium]|nr:hypothetical protein [Bacteroidota bacterium]MBS1540603.1 hypothetical protein [Bacteroidota bacterium]